MEQPNSRKTIPVSFVNEYNKRALGMLEGRIYGKEGEETGYPILLPETEKESEIFKREELIRAVTLDRPDLTIFGDRKLQDKDYKFYEQIQKNIERTNFIEFFADKYEKGSFEQKRHFNEMYPEYINAMVNLVNKKADLYARWERLKVNVPESKEDMILLFLVKKKGLPVPNKDWWLPKKVGKLYKGLNDRKRYKYDGNKTLKGVKDSETYIQRPIYPRSTVEGYDLFVKILKTVENDSVKEATLTGTEKKPTNLSKIITGEI